MEQCILISNIPSMVSSAPPAQYLTPEKLKHLLSMPDTSTTKGRRHLVLLTVLYDTAARVSELVDICLRDVRLDVYKRQEQSRLKAGRGTLSRSWPFP